MSNPDAEDLVGYSFNQFNWKANFKTEKPVSPWLLHVQVGVFLLVRGSGLRQDMKKKKKR